MPFHDCLSFWGPQADVLQQQLSLLRQQAEQQFGVRPKPDDAGWARNLLSSGNDYDRLVAVYLELYDDLGRSDPVTSPLVWNAPGKTLNGAAAAAAADAVHLGLVADRAAYAPHQTVGSGWLAMSPPVPGNAVSKATQAYFAVRDAVDPMT